MSSCDFGLCTVRLALHLGVKFGETQHNSLQSGWCQADLFLKDGLLGLVICVYDNFSPKRISMQFFAGKQDSQHFPFYVGVISFSRRECLAEKLHMFTVLGQDCTDTFQRGISLDDGLFGS